MVKTSAAQRILERRRTELAVRLGLIARPSAVEGGDEVDEAAERSERLLHFASREQLVVQLREIDAALDRLHEDVYGICTTCAEEIPPARLKALPWAPRCARCQAALEEQQARLGARDRAPRPPEEDDQC